MNSIRFISRMGKGLYTVPDRWLDYSPIGKEILGWRIRCCKVPLKKEILVKLNKNEWFGPEDLMEQVPNVGCIVDLTATKRYYDGSVFQRRGIRHVKILCAGHKLPLEKDVRRFFMALDEFLGDVQSNGKVIMVHCTHGVNRTGYLVTRYLVERKGMEPAQAIQAFNEARGHPMERPVYVNAVLAMNQPQRAEPSPEGAASSTSHGESTSGWEPESAAEPDLRSHRSERSQNGDRDRALRQQRLPADERRGNGRRPLSEPVFSRSFDPHRQDRGDRDSYGHNDGQRRDFHYGDPGGRRGRNEDRQASHYHDGRPARYEGSRDQRDYSSSRGYRREDSGRPSSYSAPPWRR